MTRITITRITRLVFLVWLIMTAILLWKIAHKPVRSVAKHEIVAWNEHHEVDLPDPGALAVLALSLGD